MSEFPNKQTSLFILSFFTVFKSNAVYVKQNLTTLHFGKKFKGIVEFRGTYHSLENFKATLRHLVSCLMLFVDSREAVFEKRWYLIGLTR